MKYYLKQSFIPALYLLFADMIAFAILCLDNQYIWLKAVLCAINIGIFLCASGVIIFKEGQTAYKVMLANDLERMQMIKTGMDRPLRLTEEYKWYKGFLFGLISFTPMLLLLGLHAILINVIGPSASTSGVIASVLYFAIFAFFRLYTGTELVIPANHYFYILIAVPVVMLSYGISYLIGAKKIELQQRRIKERHKLIHGDEEI